MTLSIHPLSPDRLSDYLSFFDNMIFSEHPDWRNCYCYSFHFTEPDEEWEKEKNRLAVSRLIRERKLRGYLVYSEDIPIGWCNVNDRQNFQRLKQHYDIESAPDLRICSVVCFLVHPEYRRQGIARNLLKRIITDYSDKGYDIIEAYPDKDGESCEKNYKGPVNLYKELGFEINSEHAHYFVVRKQLNF
jgi:ribosomal protein S18 acetylase RimI-like enzyme